MKALSPRAAASTAASGGGLDARCGAWPSCRPGMTATLRRPARPDPVRPDLVRTVARPAALGPPVVMDRRPAPSSRWGRTVIEGDPPRGERRRARFRVRARALPHRH
ncbi:hypothetical protein ACQPZZ_30600 [Microbispora sp. CA-135349]|uniref:hypothetical protein n=1 Tax=Microbispora sp. CA-135349 TaxID=3239953 RepID=UPI003D93044B